MELGQSKDLMQVRVGMGGYSHVGRLAHSRRQTALKSEAVFLDAIREHGDVLRPRANRGEDDDVARIQSDVIGEEPFLAIKAKEADGVYHERDCM